MVSLRDDVRKMVFLSDAGRQWIPVCVSLKVNFTCSPREGGFHAALHCCDGWVGVPPERQLSQEADFLRD